MALPKKENPWKFMGTIPELVVAAAESHCEVAKLYKHAYKASQEPETGITIQVPAAKNVIKDCAKIAHEFIPLLCYKSLPTPPNRLYTLKNHIVTCNISISTNDWLVFVSSKPTGNQALLDAMWVDLMSVNTIVPSKTEFTNESVYGDYDQLIQTKGSSRSIEELLYEFFKL